MLFENLREADQKHVRPQAPAGNHPKSLGLRGLSVGASGVQAV